MPYVHGPTPLSGPEGISSRIQRAQPAQSADRGTPKDTVEISEVAKWKAKLAELPGIRYELVNEIRAQIEAGIYETDEKIHIAAERLVHDLREEGVL